MTQYFVFGSEAEAEAFCTDGCPVYGKDLEGNEVRDKGITTRAAEWKRHPSERKWLVKRSVGLAGKGAGVEELDEAKLFPDEAVARMLALGK
jgi:hypothetical protein